MMKPVVVTTDKDKRGVFFGYVSERGDGKDRIILVKARMAVFWDASVRGVVGLAATGPNAKCRITPQAPSIKLNGVTAVMDCTEAAAAEWEKGHWA